MKEENPEEIEAFRRERAELTIKQVLYELIKH